MFFTASSINEVNDKCYRHDEIAPRLISLTFFCFLSLRLVAEADNYGIGKQKTKQVFPFVVLKPTQESGFSRFFQQ